MSSLRTGFSARDIESAAPALASIPTIALERKSRIARSRRLLRARPRGADTLTVPHVSGRIDEVTCPRIAVLGTECTLDNRTTATVLTRALLEHGIAAIMIGTDEIGSTRDARYGIPFDAVPPPLCAEELEVKIVEAFERERPDVIVVGGQGAPNHPACSSSSFVLLGSRPHGVVLQHAPGRTHRCDFERMAMSSLACEIDLIQTFAGARVVGLTINHEGTDDAEIDASIVRYGRELGIPVTDAFARPSDALVEMVLAGLPECRSARSTPG